MDTASMKSTVRDKLGNPTTDEISDSAIEDDIEQALSTMNRIKPLHEYRELPLQEDVQTYNLEDDVINVINFWSGFGANFSFNDLLIKEGIEVNGDYNGINVFNHPSIMTIIEQKKDALDTRFPRSWEFNPDTKELIIIPAPPSSDTGVYKASVKRSIENIPDKYLDAFKDLCVAEAMETLSFKRSRISSMPTGEDSVRFDTTSAMKMAEEKRKKAIKKLGAGGGRFFG